VPLGGFLLPKNAQKLWEYLDMEIGLILTAILSGAFIGAVLGFIGAGGAMVSVPILLYLFEDVLVKEAVTIWLLGLITNVGFSLLVERIPDSVILIGFSIVLLGAAYSMLVKPIKESPEKRISAWSLVALSLLIGALTGLFGIGGGFLAIPVLVLFFHTPQNKAAGTSLLIIALNCLTALAAKFTIWSQIDWGYPLLISIAAVIVASFASKKAAKTPTVHLKRGFAFLLVGLAGFTILTQI